jgi:hypothetical protein
MYEHARRPLLIAALSGVVFAGSGCAQQPAPEYAWSHAASGEYLFAFDVDECGAEASRIGTAGSSAPVVPTASPAFFACMRERGYYLVDAASGRPLAADARRAPAAVPAPQAAR